MGKKSAPDADPRIGEAAVASAQNGAAALDFMKSQAAITNKWAADDRERYQSTFVPLQDQFIKDAHEWDSPERLAARVDQNRAAVSNNISTAQAIQARNLAAQGVNPNSGRSAALSASTGIQSGLALAGASNAAARDVRAEADAKQAAAINLGNGQAVNPGTSIGLSNGAAQAGFSANGQGLAQQGNLLNTQYQQQMQSWQASQASASGLLSGVGGILGLAFGSDETIKKDKKKPGRSLLQAVENMPVEEWTYKPGKGDGGRHVGTYAQDFQRETGMGDGKTINVIDAIGTAMGAIKELAAKVDTMGKGRSAMSEATETDSKAHEAKEPAKMERKEKRNLGRGLPEEYRMAA